jgi:hypothetical protein
MPYKPFKKPLSKAQARFFGAAAGGDVPGFDSKEAKGKLKGVKEASLPDYKLPPGKGKRK